MQVIQVDEGNNKMLWKYEIKRVFSNWPILLLQIGKDQSLLEADLPSDDKTLKFNIAQIANLIRRFEELKTRLRGHKGSLVSKHM